MGEASDSADDFARTQAAGAGVNPFRRTLNDRLNATNVGFPCTVGTSVGVGYLNSE